MELLKKLLTYLIRIQNWKQLRTHCFNMRTSVFGGWGFQFNREYEYCITGDYKGMFVVIETPWEVSKILNHFLALPLEKRVFIPSIKSLNYLLDGCSYEQIKRN